MLHLPNAHAGMTVRKRDIGLRRFRRNGKDAISPVGIRYSELDSIYESSEFRKFEKANKERRGQMWLHGDVDHLAPLALRYARNLLHRNNCEVMEIKNIDYLRNKPLNPLLKWRGGKASDLRHLRQKFADLFPKKVNRYYEPFLGGGAVWLAMEAKYPSFVNDICVDLVDFYDFIKSLDEKFFDCMVKLEAAWDAIHAFAQDHHKSLYKGDVSVLEKQKDVFSKISLTEDCYPVIEKILKNKLVRIDKLDKKNNIVVPTDKDSLDNVEGALKGGYYTYVRDVYNGFITKNERKNPLRSACFYLLREYSFSSMFRYNSEGHFNVPYGGLTYNGRNPAARVEYWKSQQLQDHLKNAEFDNVDFEVFLEKHKPTEEDFIFVDPPYDSEFSTYDKNEFGKKEQERLANYLIKKTKAQFLAVMKNTDFIYNLYHDKKVDVRCVTFDKDYQVNIRNRNDRSVEHLVVYRTYG